MSQDDEAIEAKNDPDQDRRPTPTLTPQNTPNAERYVLEADAMRRRQMRTALLHGSRQTWRDHRRVWPAAVVGVIVVGVIVAGFAVMDAFRVTKENDRRKEREGQAPAAPTAPATPGPTGPSPTAPPPTPQPTPQPQ